MSSILFWQIETQQKGHFFDRVGRHTNTHGSFWVILRNNRVCHLVWGAGWPVSQVYRLNQFERHLIYLVRQIAVEKTAVLLVTYSR